MSILVTGGILVVALILLAINLMYITFALYNLGVSNLFKTIEDIFTGKNKGETAEDFLIYGGFISGTIFVIFALVIIGGIVIAVVGAPEELAGAAAEEGAAEFLPGVGNLVTGAVGTLLVVILVVVIFASTGSGILSFIAASEIKKDKDFNRKKELRQAYTDAIIAGIVGIAIVVFAILGLIGYFTFRYYETRRIAAAKKKRAQTELRGLRVLLREKAEAQTEGRAIGAARIRARTAAPTTRELPRATVPTTREHPRGTVPQARERSPISREGT